MIEPLSRPAGGGEAVRLQGESNDEPQCHQGELGPQPTVELELLGGFALRTDGRELQPTVGARRLLALLAVEPNGMTRSRAAAVLWPQLDPARAGAALRTALHRLPGERAHLVDSTPERLRLAPHITVDLVERRAVAAQLLNLALPMGAEELSRAISCELGTDLLADWEEDWLSHHQVRWRQLRLHALEALSARLSEAGWAGAAVDAALVAIHSDNLRESAHETLVAAYLAAGNQIAAHAYRISYRELLQRELSAAAPGLWSNLPAAPDRPGGRLRRLN
ncbi:BTAD domain-containing putative transcriptional regulator [Kitasatospora sp. NPDC002227]|uniref:AfsR/SARP family transcriptional regulator n=1 Tax=Kitasatospora sp. NPDC002227 TaxID=3154773 RepID=UPI003318C150